MCLVNSTSQCVPTPSPRFAPRFNNRSYKTNFTISLTLTVNALKKHFSTVATQKALPLTLSSFPNTSTTPKPPHNSASTSSHAPTLHAPPTRPSSTYPNLIPTAPSLSSSTSIPTRIPSPIPTPSPTFAPPCLNSIAAVFGGPGQVSASSGAARGVIGGSLRCRCGGLMMLLLDLHTC